jgi:hypothetical protein
MSRDIPYVHYYQLGTSTNPEYKNIFGELYWNGAIAVRNAPAEGYKKRSDVFSVNIIYYHNIVSDLPLTFPTGKLMLSKEFRDRLPEDCLSHFSTNVATICIKVRRLPDRHNLSAKFPIDLLDKEDICDSDTRDYSRFIEERYEDISNARSSLTRTLSEISPEGSLHSFPFPSNYLPYFFNHESGSFIRADLIALLGGPTRHPNLRFIPYTLS